MDESRKRAASNADAKIISSSLDKDFGNDFLSSWKVPKSGKDAIDFDVESVPKSSKKFSFDNLDDFGLDGAFDKMASFKMGMSDLDFSSPVKKKSKHSSSNGNDLSEGKKETEKDSFFSFDDFNDLGKFNLDTKLGFERNGTRKITEKNNPISSEGNKDPQRGISDKGTDVPKDSKSKEQTQTQTHDACTLKPTHLTSINPERVEQLKVDMASNDMPGEHSNEADPTKPAVNNSSHSPCSTVSAEVPTHSKVIAVPENSKEAPAVDLSKLNISRENSNNEQEVSSQSRNTSTENPYISRRSVRQSDFQNNQKEAVEESTSLNEGSHGSQSFGGTLMKPLRKTSSGTKNVEEGTSGPKNLSSSTQREIRNVKPALVNETATFSLLSKSANRKASRPPQVTSETTLNEQSGANNVIKKTNTYPTDLKREHKHAQPEKLKITSAKPYCKPGLQGLSTTSLSAKHGLEPLTAGNLSILNAPGSTSHSSEHNNATSQVLLKSSKPSEIIQGAPSKDGKRATSQLAGSRVLKVGARSGSPVSGLLLEKDSVQVSGRKGSPVLTSKIPNSLVEGRPASRSPSIRQNMPEVLFLFYTILYI